MSEFFYETEMGNPRNRSRRKSRKRTAACLAKEDRETSKKPSVPFAICDSNTETRPSSSAVFTSPDDQSLSGISNAVDETEASLSRSSHKIKLAMDATLLKDGEFQEEVGGFVLFDSWSRFLLVFAVPAANKTNCLYRSAPKNKKDFV